MGIVNNILGKINLQIFRKNNNLISFHDISDPEFWKFYNEVKDYTMTAIPNLYSLYSSVKYVVQNNIEGDFLECGVWRGGCSMLVAKALIMLGDTNRKLFLFDTFEGMSEPTEKDIDVNNLSAATQLKENKKLGKHTVWCIADLDDVKNNMNSTHYPKENISYIKGKVEETLPGFKLEGELAILRLDTDWYESTKAEMEILYPKLCKNGVLFIDDYGHWQGARQAVDEYFKANDIHMFLNRVDYTCRVGIKVN